LNFERYKMKKLIFLIVSVVFIIGCTKTIIKTPNSSIEIQKQDANKAWRELDKE